MAFFKLFLSCVSNIFHLTFFFEIFLIAILSPLNTPTVEIDCDGKTFSLIIEPRPELAPNWVKEKFCEKKNKVLSCKNSVTSVQNTS